MKRDQMRNHRNLWRGIGLGWVCLRGAASAGIVLQSAPQTAVNAAIAAPLISYGRAYSGGAYTNGSFYGGASIVLAAASYAGNTTADLRLLTQIGHSIVGSNAICANGGYPAQHELHATGMFAIAKHTPRIWNQLSQETRKRIDLLMKAALVASAFTTSDNNPYILAGTGQRTLDDDPNIHRGWNPNYREGMIGGILMGVCYFDGPAQADAVLKNYNHTSFVAELLENGLSNPHTVFNWKAANPGSAAPTGAQIEYAVKNYRFFTSTISNFMGMYQSLVTDTYGKTVNSGLNNGAGVGAQGWGRIVNGAATLPNQGMPGMLKEFDSIDAGGLRSGAIYAYDGYRPHQTNQLVLIISGHWQRGSTAANQAVALMKVGNTDLDYKLDKGYYDYFSGAGRGLIGADFKNSHGYAYVWPMWTDVLLPYHHGTSDNALPSATADADGDGTPDLVEHRLGLDPANGQSRFRVQRSANTLVWPSAINETFVVQRSADAKGWKTIANVPGMIASASFTDPSPPPGKAFYRIGLNP